MPWKYNGSVVATNKGFKKTDGYTTPRNWVTVWDDTEKKNQGLTWEDPEEVTLTDEEKLSVLRAQRDVKLRDTDYLALSDNTLSNDMKTYRQSLRDLPANTSDPANPTWPTKP